MAYGLEVWKADGTKQLGITYTISRLRYSTVVASGSSGSVTLDDITGKSTAEVGFPLTEGWTAEHHVYRSGDTIYWEPRSEQGLNGPIIGSSKTLVLVFLYD